jgi:hypothetical protein
MPVFLPVSLQNLLHGWQPALRKRKQLKKEPCPLQDEVLF